jgi:hypothetical protein
MSFWQKLREWLLGLMGVGGEDYPGSGRDVVLTVLAGFAALILIVFPTVHEPPERLRYAAVASGVVLIAGFLLARRKLVVVGGIATIVGFRALIAAALGLWQGLVIAVLAFAVVIFCIRKAEAE